MVETKLRKTSENPEIPWLSKRVPFIKVDFDNRTVEEAQTKQEKIDLIDDDRVFEKDGIVILAAWPGEWSQDVFEVDDLDQAVRALLKRK